MKITVAENLLEQMLPLLHVLLDMAQAELGLHQASEPGTVQEDGPECPEIRPGKKVFDTPVYHKGTIYRTCPHCNCDMPAGPSGICPTCSKGGAS